MHFWWLLLWWVMWKNPGLGSTPTFPRWLLGLLVFLLFLEYILGPDRHAALKWPGLPHLLLMAGSVALVRVTDLVQT